MKRTIVLGAMVALLASGAYAASIIPLMPTGTGDSIATSISADGQWVAGAGVGTLPAYGTYKVPMYWYGPTGATTEFLPNTKGTGYYGGIDSGNGLLWTSANAGGSTYTSGEFIGRGGSHAPGAPTLSVLAPNSDVLVGGNNSAAYSPLVGDGFIVGQNTKNTSAHVWKWGNGLSPWRTVNGTGELVLNSVSQTVRAIGSDKGGTRPNGTTGQDRAVWVEAGATTVQAIPNSPGGAGNWGQGKGISPDGMMFTGYMHQYAAEVTDQRLQGFVWKQGEANSVKLLPAGGDLVNEQSYGYDVTDDGTAVGYSWISGPGSRACIWLSNGDGTYANDGKAYILMDWLPTIGVDLTGWTSLGSAPTGIAALGGGQYAIVGTGNYEGVATAYYIVTPEPAMALLALSGLSLLLRRRR